MRRNRRKNERKKGEKIRGREEKKEGGGKVRSRGKLQGCACQPSLVPRLSPLTYN